MKPITTSTARIIRLSLLTGLLLAAPAIQAATLYVSGYSGPNSFIRAFTTTGVGSVFANGASGVVNPQGLAIDGAGNIYVANYSNNTIQKFTSGGVGSVFADSSSGLVNPQDLAIDSEGNLFVANSGNSTIQKFSTITGTGTVFASDVSAVRGLTFDSSGNLYATIGNTIKQFNSGGVSSVFASTGLNNPQDLAFDSAGNLFVSNYQDNTIMKFTPGGVGSLFADGSSGLWNPTGLAFGSAGNLFVGNNATGQIYEFTSGGVGTIFANAGINPRYLAFGADAVPEPSRALLLCGGLMGMVLRRRRVSNEA